MEQAPEEAYVQRDPTPASNKRAILETFESTLFSWVVERMPQCYQDAYKELNGSRHCIAGLCEHFGWENPDLQRALTKMGENAAGNAYSASFPYEYENYGPLEDFDFWDVFINEEFHYSNLEDSAVHANGQAPGVQLICFD